MSYTVTEKNVGPILVVTHLESHSFDTLRKKFFELFDVGKKVLKPNGSFFCLCNENSFTRNSVVKLCAPLENSSLEFDKNKYKMEVLQRTNVISTIHQGSYDDLDQAFTALLAYGKEHEKELTLPCRIIFHKEKRKWTRGRFFKRSPKQYITEVQIPLAEK
ncbi:MAG: hypothetical protein R3Y63_05130 [Eubacteriales bacterium]